MLFHANRLIHKKKILMKSKTEEEAVNVMTFFLLGSSSYCRHLPLSSIKLQTFNINSFDLTKQVPHSRQDIGGYTANPPMLMEYSEFFVQETNQNLKCKVSLLPPSFCAKYPVI